MADPDFDTTHRYKNGRVPHLDNLQTDTALLRRIAHGTDTLRFYLGWLLAITVLGIVAAVIVGIVLIVHTPSPAPAATPDLSCELVPANC
jgi:hypothetical protein